MPIYHPDFTTKKAIFAREGVSKTTGYRMLRDITTGDRTAHSIRETRGCKTVLSAKDLRHIEDLLDNIDFSEKSMTYDAIIAKLDLRSSVRTLQCEFHNLDYWKCIACVKGYISPKAGERRVEFCQIMLSRYPDKQDWHHVRFSDESHFGVGPQGKLLIFRKPGQRYYSNCIQERDEKLDKEVAWTRRVHAWGAMGHSFKSNLEWYTIPPNRNAKSDQKTGKMTADVYLNRILIPIIQPWLKRGDKFVLEEDNDSSHRHYSGNYPQNRKLKT
jgi:hypothetical protein